MRSALPSGTVTFLFTDIEGSTRLAQEHPAELPALLAQHHALLRQAIEALDGHVLQIIGDGVCAAFHTAPAAVQAAVQAQRRLQETDWSPAALRVRMGLHTGAAQPARAGEPGNYNGYLTLTRAQRVMSAAHGGQILVSGPTAELLAGALPDGAGLRDMGAHRLKGLTSPEHLWQVVAPGLAGEFPPLQSLEARPNNLPIPLTTFFGRQAELAEALRLLGKHRLITLTGPGGTGKTRLALQAATQALEGAAFPDGAWLIELAPIANGEFVLPAAAAALSLHDQPGRPLQAALADFLRHKRLLLILDNCEHLIETCAQVAALMLQAGAGVKLLASSREPLGIAGEALMRVPSLPLPREAASFEEIQHNDAVQLFVERARAVKPGFALTAENAEAVGQICRRLDGIPLAIELAAARTALFSPAGIASRLDDRFRLLTGSNRSALPRQQTLEALIDWSYGLLTAEEKALFQALSVFAGGFTFEAAEAVMADDILDLLAPLVNKSLVLTEEDSPSSLGEPRYRLLETIRQYAASKLLAAGGVEAARDRHQAYYDRFATEAEAARGAANQRRWARRQEAERDNLRAAIEWALERQPAAAIAMISRQVFFWGQRRYAAEALRWLEAGLAKIGSQPEGALPAGGDGTAAARQRTLAQAYWARAILLEVQGDMPPAFAALQESAGYWRTTGDRRSLARVLCLLGAWGVFFGVPNPYRATVEEGLELGRQLNDGEIIGAALSALGIEKMLQGDYGTAHTDIEASVAALRRAGDERFANLGRATLGQMALLQGDLPAACALFAESLAVFEDFQNFYYANIARAGLAEALRLAGDFAQAVPLLVDTLAEWQAAGNHGGVARCLECLAFVGGTLAQSQPAQQARLLRHAGRLLGAAAALREAAGYEMPAAEREEYDRQLGLLRALPTAAELQAGWDEGQTLTIDEVRAVGESLMEYL